MIYAVKASGGTRLLTSDEDYAYRTLDAFDKCGQECSVIAIPEEVLDSDLGDIIDYYNL